MRLALRLIVWSTAVNRHYTRKDTVMMMTRGRLVVLGGLSLYLFVFGFAGGVPARVVR
jgi:hypothetical protein